MSEGLELAFQSLDPPILIYSPYLRDTRTLDQQTQRKRQMFQRTSLRERMDWWRTKNFGCGLKEQTINHTSSRRRISTSGLKDLKITMNDSRWCGSNLVAQTMGKLPKSHEETDSSLHSLIYRLISVDKEYFVTLGLTESFFFKN